jgi:hypothetical protein
VLSANGSLAISGASRWLEANNAVQLNQSNITIEDKVLPRFVKLVIIRLVTFVKNEKFGG